MRFWVGGYTPDGEGSASGIGVLLAGAADDGSAGGPLAFTGDAAATGGSPSWITAHPTLDVLYAALESDGTVQAFRRTGEATYARLGEPVAAGAAPCHIAVAPDGTWLVASCWGDGRVVRMDLDAAGRPTTTVPAPSPRDPYAAGGADGSGGEGAGGLDLAAAAQALRDAAGEEYAHLVPDYDDGVSAVEEAEPAVAASRVPHAHQAIFLPGGLIATTDMGFDTVRFFRDGSRGLREVQTVALPRGSGPRHGVWHPSGHLYVLTELSCEVFVLAPDADGTWRLVGGVPVGAGTEPGDTAAQLCSSRDGAFVYAGMRGSNTVSTLRVRGSGETVSPVALVDAGVDWPRHHVVVRDTLLVAGQRSDDVASRSLDIRTGVPGGIRHRTAVPTPACLVPDRR